MGPPKPPEVIYSLPTPEDAVHLAMVDIATIHPHHRYHIRYLFLGDSMYDERSKRTASLVINYISRWPGINKPAVVGNGILLRIDLSRYCPTDKDLQEWLTLWENLQYDPSFSLLLTKDTLRFAEKRGLPIPKQFKEIPQPPRWEQVEIDHPGGKYVYPDDSGVVQELAKGKWKVWHKYNVPPKRVGVIEDKQVIRFNSGAIDPIAFKQLQEETQSLAPIVEHRYFKVRVLSTIKATVGQDPNKNTVFKTIFGGLYYEFKGIRLAKEVLGKDTKTTDLDLFFQDIGIGNIKGGETSNQLFDRLRSDQRAAMRRSGVTHKPRDIVMFNTPNGREGSGWGSITGDVNDEDIDIGDRAYANLLNPRRKAREAIFPDPSGLHRFALFNGQGNRQDEVPHSIADDYTIPKPVTQRLQAAIGCIVCHSSARGGGKDGWQPMTNDIKKLIARSVDIFDDLSPRKAREYTVDREILVRLQGLYTGDFSRNFMRAQEDLSVATLQATGPWKESKTGDQTDVCRLASERLQDEYGSFKWKMVDAKEALADMGLDVPQAQALNLFNTLIPPDPDAYVGNPNDPFGGVILEDSRIALIKEGMDILRDDWSLCRDFAATRLQKNPAYVKMRGAAKPRTIRPDQ